MNILNYFRKDLKTFFSLLKDHNVILFIVIFSYFVSYGLNLFLARILDPIDYGDISVVIQLIIFFTPLALMGAELSMLKFLPGYLERHEYAKVAGFIRWAFEMFLVMAAIILLVGSIIVFILFTITMGEFPHFERFHIMVYSFWLIPVYALINLLATILQALKRYYLSSTFTGMKGYGLTLLMILSLGVLVTFFNISWYGRDKLRFSIILCLGAACLVVVGYLLGAVKNSLPPKVFQVRPHFERRSWFYSSLKMLGSTMIFAGLSAIDIVMIEIFAKDNADVGHFASILVIASSIAVFGGAVDMIISPMIHPCVEGGSKKHLQSVIHITNLFKSLPAILFTVIIFLFGEMFLRHFGKSFVGAYPSLTLLAIGFLVGLFFSSSGALLVYTKHAMLNFYISLAQFIYIFVLDVIFIPLFGLYGAVVILTSSIILSSFVRAFYVRRFLKIKSFFIF